MLIIPAVDLIGGRCVRLYQGDYEQRTQYAGDPVEQALKFQSAGFRRMHLIDLEGARSGGGRNRTVIRRVIDACRVPVQVGGGIRTAADVEELLEMGADYLILGTAALETPDAVTQWLRRWGPEHFIVSLDLRNGALQTEGWLGQSDRSLQEAVDLILGWSIRQIISTDVEQDGTLEQPGYSTYRKLLEMLNQRIALIAAGGISAPEHIRCLKDLGLEGAVVGRALYEGHHSWEGLLSAG